LLQPHRQRRDIPTLTSTNQPFCQSNTVTQIRQCSHSHIDPLPVRLIAQAGSPARQLRPTTAKSTAMRGDVSRKAAAKHKEAARVLHAGSSGSGLGGGKERRTLGGKNLQRDMARFMGYR